MNREIKFRAWDGNEMLYEGWNNDFFATKEVVFRYDNVMQYTGLKDKNGKEVYEGDVVRFVTTRDWHGYIGCVVWGGDGCYELHTTDNTAPRLYMLPDVVSQMDVIGNIYENPELIK